MSTALKNQVIGESQPPDLEPRHHLFELRAWLSWVVRSASIGLFGVSGRYARRVAESQTRTRNPQHHISRACFSVACGSNGFSCSFGSKVEVPGGSLCCGLEKLTLGHIAGQPELRFSLKNSCTASPSAGRHCASTVSSHNGKFLTTNANLASWWPFLANPWSKRQLSLFFSLSFFHTTHPTL